mgnify:FL=1|jgi:hypothetical protein|tara:strand:- start:584 stop:871 length:288 start_codon:yes stop_codon:yes gene_type:complete
MNDSMKKPLEEDDPMQMKAQMVAGDPHLMLDCLIEEFARMGWDASQIIKIFENPVFLASHGLTKRFGHKTILDRIVQTLERCGVFHFKIIEQKPV